ERLLPGCFRERAEDRDLSRREEMLGHRLDLQTGADLLDVDADAAAAGDCIQRQFVRMRYVELEGRVTGWARQGGLARVVILEAQSARLHAQVAPEDGAQQAAPDDEPLAVSVEMEAGRPRSLIVRQDGIEGRSPRAVQIRSP